MILNLQNRKRTSPTQTANRGRDPFNQNFRKFRSKTEWIGSVQPGRVSKTMNPPFELDHFSRLDRSDRQGPFHLTIPTHSQSWDLAVRYLPCTKWRKMLITVLLWIVNSRSIGVTRTYMYSMFWLLTALKDDLFPQRIWNVLFVIRFKRWCLKSYGKISGNGLLKITLYTG